MKNILSQFVSDIESQQSLHATELSELLTNITADKRIAKGEHTDKISADAPCLGPRNILPENIPSAVDIYEEEEEDVLGGVQEKK